MPFDPAVQFLLYVFENVLYIDIIDRIGRQERKYKKHQIWFLNHIWFKLGEVLELGMGKVECGKEGRWKDEKVGRAQSAWGIGHGA